MECGAIVRPDGKTRRLLEATAFTCMIVIAISFPYRQTRRLIVHDQNLDIQPVRLAAQALPGDSDAICAFIRERTTETDKRNGLNIGSLYQSTARPAIGKLGFHVICRLKVSRENRLSEI